MSAPKRKTVLVTGANGYIGNAVARAFVRAGWITYGLVRSQSSRPALHASEIFSILGSAADEAFIARLATQSRIGPFDVLVSCTEQITDYLPHFNDTITLLRTLAKASSERGVRPLVIFTSGCKDYGTTALHGDPDLRPHTEQSPLNPPPFAKGRASNAPKIFTHDDLFDAVLVRPTTLYGLSSSFYGPIFDIAAKAANEGKALEFAASPNSIMHGTHIDDCAEAYVAIAVAERDVVAGQSYNISSVRYETLDEVAQALVNEYGISSGVNYLPEPGETSEVMHVVQMLYGFSQWVSSEKLRREVGWSDRRRGFVEGLHIYRKAYEAAVKVDDPGVQRIRGFVRMVEDRKGDGQ